MASPNAKNWLPELTNFGSLANNPINTNLAASTNYRFVCEKIPNVTYFCTSAQTPNLTSTPSVYNHLFAANDIKFPGGRASSDISIRFIIDENFRNYMEMVSWMRSGVPYRDFREIAPDTDTTINYGKLFFLDNKKVPVLVMNFQNLIPTQISGFTLSHTENEPSVLTATVNFVFDVFDVSKA
jgi:hypothetical protein